LPTTGRRHLESAWHSMLSSVLLKPHTSTLHTHTVPVSWTPCPGSHAHASPPLQSPTIPLCLLPPTLFSHTLTAENHRCLPPRPPSPPHAAHHAASRAAHAGCKTRHVISPPRAGRSSPHWRLWHSAHTLPCSTFTFLAQHLYFGTEEHCSSPY